MSKKKAIVKEGGLRICFYYRIEGDNITILNNKVRINDGIKSIIKVFQVNPAKVQKFYFLRNGQKRVSLVKERKISCHFNDDTWIHLVYDFNTNSFTLENYKLNIF